MNLLDWSTAPQDILSDFPMLEDATASELAVMKEGCSEEDAPFVRAIDILLKHIELGTYYVPTTDDDDFPGMEPERPQRRS